MASLMYTADTAVTAGIPSGSTLSPGSIYRKEGCAIQLSGENVLLRSPGYYLVYATFTVLPSASDAVIIQALQDGVAIPGATGKYTGSTAHTVPIAFMVKNSCCKAASIISFEITAATAGTTITQQTGAVSVVKI